MYTSTSFQRLKLRNAETLADLESTPLILHFEGMNDSSWSDVVFHLQDAMLARALATAINGVLKAHYAGLAAKEPSDAQI